MATILALVPMNRLQKTTEYDENDWCLTLLDAEGKFIELSYGGPSVEVGEIKVSVKEVYAIDKDHEKANEFLSAVFNIADFPGILNSRSITTYSRIFGDSKFRYSIFNLASGNQYHVEGVNFD